MLFADAMTIRDQIRDIVLESVLDRDFDEYFMVRGCIYSLLFAFLLHSPYLLLIIAYHLSHLNHPKSMCVGCALFGMGLNDGNLQPYDRSFGENVWPRYEPDPYTGGE